MKYRTVPTIAVAILLTGCASIGHRTAEQKRIDPFESFNRSSFELNEVIDRNLLRPIAKVYQDTLPSFVRTGIRNFFGNFQDAWSMVNNVLQGKPGPAAHDLMRVGTNTIFGLGGLLDFGTEFGLKKSREDFGQTLGYWGVPAGPYMVLPIIGPSTLRDTIATPVNARAMPEMVIDNGKFMEDILAFRVLSDRADLLNATDVLDDIATDKYTFVRDAYLARRESLVRDGETADDGEYAPSEAEENERK